MQPECLVLDDSRIVRRIAHSLMEARGFSVREAADGRDAMDQLQAHPADLLLVDWNMPDIDGPAFIRAVRAYENLPQPKILLFSTETRIAAIRYAIRQGADSYLLKPFDREKLDHRLRRFGFAA